MEKFQCSQCGATDFTHEGRDMLRCKYCLSLFRIPEPQQEKGGLVIGSGAHVVFGKSSKVVVRGGMSVSPGAHVQFLGQLEVIEKSTKEKVEAAKLALRKEKDSGKASPGNS